MVLEGCSGIALMMFQGNSRFGQEIAQYLQYRWTSNLNGLQPVKIRWLLPGNCSNVTLPILDLGCREYIPGRHEDSQTIQWQVNGKTFSETLPPFAVSDDGLLSRDVGVFLRQSQAQVEQYIYLGSADELSRLTFAEARRFRDKGNELVRLALQIRSGSVLCQGFGTLIGDETLGIKPLGFHNQPEECLYDKFNACSGRPVPEAIDHQIDVAILQWLRKFQHELSGKITKILFPSGKRTKRLPWYELFLTFYIIMSNLEFIHGGALAYMESQRRTVSATALVFCNQLRLSSDQRDSNEKVKSVVSSKTWSPNSNRLRTVCLLISASS
jgi:hypothetical protein